MFVIVRKFVVIRIYRYDIFRIKKIILKIVEED